VEIRGDRLGSAEGVDIEVELSDRGLEQMVALMRKFSGLEQGH
jgi:hypothetical protein